MAKIIAKCKSSKYFKNCIKFILVKCPDMPSNLNRCNYFLCFSLKISKHLTILAKLYIKNVYKIAKKHFGSKVHF